MKHLFTLLTLMLILFSCEKKQAEPKAVATKSHESHSEASHGDDMLAHLVSGYLEIKDALVEERNDGAVKGATHMLAAFKSFPVSQLKAEQTTIFNEIYENSKEQLEHIQKSDIAHQREHFLELSKDMIDLVKLIGTKKPLYKEYCSMYKGNKGGTWLSDSPQIRNPYFGSKMLKCGKVLEEI